MYIAIIKSLDDDAYGKDLSGNTVPMPTGSTHLVSINDLGYYKDHPDVFQIVNASASVTTWNSTLDAFEDPVSGANFKPTRNYVSGVPIGIAPSGTVAANGALTLGTALINIYGPNNMGPGVYLYFPAGAVYAGSVSGPYWCVMTGTTAGTIYNNIQTFPGIVDMPVTNTPIVAAGPGAYVALTTQCTVMSVTIPGNSMGKRGAFRQTYYSTQTPDNLTVYHCYFGGSEYNNGIAGTNTGMGSQTVVANRGTPTFQGRPTALVSFNFTNYSLLNIDTTLDQVARITIEKATATANVIIDFSSIEVLFS